MTKEERLMRKTMITTLAAFAFAFMTTAAMAKSQICEITTIEGGQVTLQCDQTEGLSIGDTVKLKVKSKKKSTSIEGC